jgi:hypothetical protein
MVVSVVALRLAESSVVGILSPTERAWHQGPEILGSTSVQTEPHVGHRHSSSHALT